MQQSPNRKDAYAPGAAGMKAAVAGRELEVTGVKIDRSLPDPFTGGSLTSASASFTAVEGADVTTTVATPWDPGSQWPPVPQSSASVSMDTGAGSVSLLGNGVVMSASGGTGGREVDVEVADAYESLNRTISWDGVAANMPGLAEQSLGRYVGMGTTSITDMILRECGWYSTPPLTNYVMVSVPAQGTLWPERGYVDLSGRQGGNYPYWSRSIWGIGVADIDATYTLAGGGYSLNSRGGIELSAMTQTSPDAVDGIMYMDVEIGAPFGAAARMSWDDNNAFVRVRNAGGSYVTVVSVPRSNGLLYASIERVSSTSIRATIRSGSETATAGINVFESFTSGAMKVARIWGTGCAGGFMVAAPGTQGRLVGWKPNAVLYPRMANRNSLDVRPPIEGENCADLLAQQCEAEGATYWIDETGVLRWWDLARLEAQSSVATLNDADDIAEGGFTWSHDMSQVKSRVSVKWRDAMAAQSWRTSIDLWQGSGETLQPGDVLEDWINVPDDEVWIMPDLVLERAGTSSTSDLNNALMSFYGGVVPGESGEADEWAQNHGSLLMTVERVTDRSFKTWIQWTGSKVAVMRLPNREASSALWRIRRENDMPIIRGKQKWTFADQITYSAQSGPATAPEHEIDAGWWIQDLAQAQYIADYAGARLTVAQPVLSSVDLIPFPGLQLGDVVEVHDTSVTRLTIRGIVVEDSRDIDADMGMTHAVSIRPTFISRNGVTYEMWGSVVNGSTYQQWGTRQVGDTYADWGNVPLRREAVI